MEKKVMVRLCANIVAKTDLYETDKEVQNLDRLGTPFGADKRKQQYNP